MQHRILTTNIKTCLSFGKRKRYFDLATDTEQKDNCYIKSAETGSA